MRKLNLKPYDIEVANPARLTDVDAKPTIMQNYELRRSLGNILLAPASQMTKQQLDPVGLMRNGDIYRKIKNAKGNFVLLEDHEYDQLKISIDAFRGYGRNEEEMVRRVYDAEKIKVKEDKPEKEDKKKDTNKKKSRK